MPPTLGTTDRSVSRATNNKSVAQSTPATNEMHSISIDSNNTASNTNNDATESISIPVATTEHADLAEQIIVKQGQKCCGVCCDFRRAVIIVNVLIILLEAILLVLVATGVFGKVMLKLDGGSNHAFLMDKYNRIQMIFSGISALLSLVAIVGAANYSTVMVGINAVWLLVEYVLGIVLVLSYCNNYCNEYLAAVMEDEQNATLTMLTGRFNHLQFEYEQNASATNGPLQILYCACSLNIPVTIAAGVAMCLWIYPHVGFIVQVRRGIMSKETYPRQQYSCCCV